MGASFCSECLEARATDQRKIIQTPKFQRRFFAKVSKCDGEGCWEWTASVDRTGYGKIIVGKTLVPSVEDLDDHLIYLAVDEVPDVCVIVTRAALGLVECIACDGRGEYSYRVQMDEWESDECGCCDGLGSVTPEVAAQLEADRERMLDEQMRNG